MPWQSLIRGGLFGSKAEEASDSAYEYPALISLSMQAARSTPSSVQDQQVPAKDRTSIAPTPKRMTAEGSPDQIRVSEPPFPKPEQTSKPAAAPKPTKKGPVVRAQPASGPPTKIRSRPQPSARLLDARIGKHEGFIRIVLDLSAESKFTTGFDRDGKVVIRLPGVLAAPGTRPLNDDYFPATALVTTSTPGNGTEITVNASKSVSVKSFDLEPDRIGGHRIVVDLIEAPGTPR